MNIRPCVRRSAELKAYACLMPTETRPMSELAAINLREYREGIVSPTFMILDSVAG